MPSRHLLIVAHGSRRQASNLEVEALADRVRDLDDPDIDQVAVAFLELAEPSIPEGLARCVERGAEEIVVFPYFLAAGTHVARDIPEALAEFEARHPQVKLRLASHLGASTSLPGTILDVVGQTV
jgi:sirohydrochlorin ferrochelatase